MGWALTLMAPLSRPALREELPVAKEVMSDWPVPLEPWFHSWSSWVGPGVGGEDGKEGHSGKLCGGHHVSTDSPLG